MRVTETLKGKCPPFVVLWMFRSLTAENLERHLSQHGVVST